MNQAYMAHFAVTDAQGNRFHHFERTGRGASASPGRPPAVPGVAGRLVRGGAGAATLPIRLRAADGGASVDLVLDTTRPIVPQGDRGFSRKGAAPGNASHYYSMTRLATRGTVRVDGVSFPVEGNSWLDREWGTSALEKGQAGWDWFALQLSDGRDLMFYRLRTEGGGTDPFSAGTLVLPDGSHRPLSPDNVRIEDLESWRSPESGVRYPSRWRLRLPHEGLELEVFPRIRGPGIADRRPVLGRGGRYSVEPPRRAGRGGRVRRADGVRGNGRALTGIQSSRPLRAERRMR